MAVRRWQIDADPLFSDRRILLRTGEAMTTGSLERPSLVFQGNRATHFVAAAADGPGWFQGMTRSFIVTCAVPREESCA